MTLDEQKAVIQALIDGRTVKIFNKSSEMPIGKCTPDHQFDFIRWRYEIQREPMEIWVNVYPDGRTCSYEREPDALYARCESGRTVKFREVLDE